MYEININQVEPSTSINIENIGNTNEKIKALDQKARIAILGDVSL